jgi:methanol--5-hydroxybenzimidazolylcobamide Co-methyltransferase
MKRYTALAISDLDQFVFGRAPLPVKAGHGLAFGGGTVYPEINFTLPPMEISADSLPEVRAQYAGMIEGVCARAVELQAPGLVVEYELLPPMTLEPDWGADVTAILRGTLDKYARSDGLKSALRVTPTDIRGFQRPPRMRSGQWWDRMMRSFELNAAAGANLLSIESVGGKEVCDEALLYGDLPRVTFALGILACRDMASLWDAIVTIADLHGAVPAGDGAGGFGNTALMLAYQRYIPKVWAATVRVMTVARSLVAFERGALGPSKDAAFEGPYLKAITGRPISMAGAGAAVALPSPFGNLAQAVADLISNDTIQNVKLMAGMAPTVSVEQLIYAARLLNHASRLGGGATISLRDCLADPDAALDPQAYVLRPDVVLRLARQIVSETTPYRRTRRAAQSTLEALRQAHAHGQLAVPDTELGWLDRLSRQADQLPEDEQQFVAAITPTLDLARVRLDSYGL